MTDPAKAYAVTQDAVHELIEETKRLLADRDNDRLEVFAVTSRTYAAVLAWYAERSGEHGLAASCAYSGRAVAMLLLEVVELETITQGLVASADTSTRGPGAEN